MKAIFKREFKAYFTSPVGFAVLAIFYLFSGIMFGVFFQAGQPDISGIFAPWLFVISLVIIPILTMRLFSEDKRQKTDQLMLTSPVKLRSIVLGKFFAAFSVFVIAIAITIVYQLIISFYSPAVDWMVFMGNFFGILLYGAALIAVGMFISALTESQVTAAIASFAAELGLALIPMIISTLLGEISNTFVKYIVKFFDGISILDRYSNFMSGTMNYADILFFLSVAGLFLFFSVMVTERRRYA